MWNRSFPGPCLVVFLALSSAACLGPCQDRPYCDTDAQCAQDWTCVDNRCVAGKRDAGGASSSSGVITASTSTAGSSSTGVSTSTSNTTSSASTSAGGSSLNTPDAGNLDASTADCGPQPTCMPDQCGALLDGCGQPIRCAGTCSLPLACGGGGTGPLANTCGAHPQSSASHDPQVAFGASAPRLALPKAWGTALLAPPYVYILGGYGSGQPDVQRATLQLDGTLTPFEAVAGVDLAARFGHAQAVHRNRVYLLGGFDPINNTTLDSVVTATISPQGDLSDFTLAGTMLHPRSSPALQVVGNDLYVMGGFSFDAGTLQDVERGSLRGDGGVDFAPFEHALPFPLAAATTARVADQVVLVGGSRADVVLNQVVKAAVVDGGLGPFSVATGALAVGRAQHAMLALDRKLVVLAGTVDEYSALEDVETSVVDDQGNVNFVRRPAALRQARYATQLLQLPRVAYLLGGTTHPSGPPKVVVDDVERVALVRDAFVVPVGSGTLRRGRAQHAMVVSGGYVLLLGGVDPGGATPPTEYGRDPGDGGLQFEDLPPNATVDRQGHCAVRLDNHVLVLGGAVNNTVTGSAVAAPLVAHQPEAFMTLASALAVPRREHSCVVLGDQVVVVGGRNDAGTALASVESATWTVTNGVLQLGAFTTLPLGLSTPRFGHTQAIVGNRLFILGGRGASGPLDTGEATTISPTGALVGFSALSGSLPQPRAFAAGFVVGESLYLLGGETTGGALADATASTLPAPPAANLAFQPRPVLTLPQPRVGATVLSTPGGAWVLGGVDADGGLPPDTLQLEFR